MAISLHASRFGLAEHKRLQWHVIMPEGTPFDACLDPGYWAHIASKLKPGAEITVIDDRMSFYARLIVRDAGRVWAKVSVLEYKELEEAVAGAPDGYEVSVEYAGPHDKHRVYREQDGKKVVLSRHHETKEAALKWAEDHKRTIGMNKAA